MTEVIFDVNPVSFNLNQALNKKPNAGFSDALKQVITPQKDTAPQPALSKKSLVREGTPKSRQDAQPEGSSIEKADSVVDTENTPPTTDIPVIAADPDIINMSSDATAEQALIPVDTTKSTDIRSEEDSTEPAAEEPIASPIATPVALQPQVVRADNAPEAEQEISLDDDSISMNSPKLDAKPQQTETEAPKSFKIENEAAVQEDTEAKPVVVTQQNANTEVTTNKAEVTTPDILKAATGDAKNVQDNKAALPKELSSMVEAVTIKQTATPDAGNDHDANNGLNLSAKQPVTELEQQKQPEITFSATNVLEKESPEGEALEDAAEITLATSVKHTDKTATPAKTSEPNKAAFSATQQITDAIENLRNNQQKQITLDLHPAELGRVQVQLEFQSGQIKTVNIVIEKRDTLEIMRADSHVFEKAIKEVNSGNEASLSFNLPDGNHGHSEYSAETHFAHAAEGNDTSSIVPPKALVSKYDASTSAITRNANGEIITADLRI